MKNSKYLIISLLILITFIGFSTISAAEYNNDNSIFSDSDFLSSDSGNFNLNSSDDDFGLSDLSSGLNNLLTLSNNDKVLTDDSVTYPYDTVTLFNTTPYASMLPQDLGVIEVYWKDGEIIGVTQYGTYKDNNGNVSTDDMITSYNDQLNKVSSQLAKGEQVYPVSNSSTVETNNSTGKSDNFVKSYDKVTKIDTAPYASMIGGDFGVLEIYWKDGKVIGVTPEGSYEAANGNVPTSSMITSYNDKLNQYASALQGMGDVIYDNTTSNGNGTNNSSSNSSISPSPSINSGGSSGLGLGSLFSGSSNPLSFNNSTPGNNSTNNTTSTGMQNTGLPVILLIIVVIVIIAVAVYYNQKKR